MRTITPTFTDAVQKFIKFFGLETPVFIRGGKPAPVVEI